jgi:hypothetical protein
MLEMAVSPTNEFAKINLPYFLSKYSFQTDQLMEEELPTGKKWSHFR